MSRTATNSIRALWAAARRSRGWHALAGSILIAMIGWVLSFTPLIELSYDLATVLGWRRPAVFEAAVIYIDDGSVRNLKLSDPPARSIYATLLRALKEAGAKLVVFDIQFDLERPGDPEFAQALRDYGPAILAAPWQSQVFSRSEAGQTLGGQAIEPTPVLRDAVSNRVALAAVDPADGSPASPRRRLIRWIQDRPTLAEAAARLVTPPHPFPKDPPLWVRYPGPAFSVPFRYLEQVVAPDSDLGDVFRQKVVFVGAHPNFRPDTHTTPFQRFAWLGDASYAHPMSGVELHATSFMNLVAGNALRRLPWPWEMILLFITAVSATALLMLGTARTSWLLALLLAPGVTVASAMVAGFTGFWLPCAILGLQIPLALAWSFAAPSRRRIRTAFLSYRRVDVDAAALLQRCLEERGLRVYRDSTDLEIGPWKGQLEQAIQTSSFFILLVTPRTIRTTTGHPERLAAGEEDWIRRELGCVASRRDIIIPVWKVGGGNGVKLPRQDRGQSSPPPAAADEFLTALGVHSMDEAHEALGDQSYLMELQGIVWRPGGEEGAADEILQRCGSGRRSSPNR